MRTLARWLLCCYQLLEGVTGEERRRLKKRLKKKKQRKTAATTAAALASAAALSASSSTKVVLIAEGGLAARRESCLLVEGVAYVVAPDGGIACFDTTEEALVYSANRKLSALDEALVISTASADGGLETPTRSLPPPSLLPSVSPIDVTASTGARAAPTMIHARVLTTESLAVLTSSCRLTPMRELPASCFTTLAYAIQSLALNVTVSSAKPARPSNVYQLTTVKPDAYTYPPTAYAARLCFAAPVADVVAAFGRPAEGPADAQAEWIVCAQRSVVDVDGCDDDAEGDGVSEVGSADAAAAAAASGALKKSKSARRRAAKKKAKEADRVMKAMQEGAAADTNASVFLIRGQGFDVANIAGRVRHSMLLGPEADAGLTAIWGIRFDVRHAALVLDAVESLLPSVKFVVVPTLSFAGSALDCPARRASAALTSAHEELKKAMSLPVSLKAPASATPPMSAAVFDGNTMLFGLPLAPDVFTSASSTISALMQESIAARAVADVCVAGSTAVAGDADINASMLVDCGPSTAITLRALSERVSLAGLAGAAGRPTASLAALRITNMMPDAAFEFESRPPVQAAAAAVPPSTPGRSPNKSPKKSPGGHSAPQDDDGDGAFDPELYMEWERSIYAMDAKVVDLGNACWTYKHFSEEIQTRQV